MILHKLRRGKLEVKINYIPNEIKKHAFFSLGLPRFIHSALIHITPLGRVTAATKVFIFVDGLGITAATSIREGSVP